MKKIRPVWPLCALSLLLVAATCSVEQDPAVPAAESLWPKEYSNEAGDRLVMSEPEVTAWNAGERLAANVSVEYWPEGSKSASPGTIGIEADALVDIEAGLVHLSTIDIIAYYFPTLEYEHFQKLLDKLSELLPRQDVAIGLDRARVAGE